MKTIAAALAIALVPCAVQAGERLHGTFFDSADQYGSVLADIGKGGGSATAMQPGVGSREAQMVGRSPSAGAQPAWRGTNPDLDGSILHNVGHVL
jgi:hypothetical protein